MCAIFFLTSMKCKKESAGCHYKIKFKNASSRDIYALDVDNLSGFFTAKYYTLARNWPADYKFRSGGNGKGKIDGFSSKNCFEESLPYYDQKKIHIVLYDAEVLENSDPIELEKQRYYLKIYELTIDDLRNMNWTIEFKD